MPSPQPSSPRNQYHQESGTKNFNNYYLMCYLFRTVIRVINLVIVCHDDLLLISSGEEEDRNQPDNDVKKDGKWWEREEINAEEFGADIDIPLVMQEGEYTGVMVEDTEDVYSMSTHSPRKKNEEENHRVAMFLDINHPSQS